jgi:hypothetical protein
MSYLLCIARKEKLQKYTYVSVRTSVACSNSRTAEQISVEFDTECTESRVEQISQFRTGEVPGSNIGPEVGYSHWGVH